MAKVFRWRYAWRRTGRQARFGECRVVEQVEVHEDGSTEVVGFEIRGNGSEFTVMTLAQCFLHDVVHHLHDVDA